MSDTENSAGDCSDVSENIAGEVRHDVASRISSLAKPYYAGLPSAPAFVFRLNKLLTEPVVDLTSVCAVLANDPCTAANVLRLANLDCTENGRRSYDLGECVVLLGVDRSRKIVLTTPLNATQCDNRQMLKFLQHSQLAARFSRRLAIDCWPSDPERAATAGLVHDIGMAVLLLQDSPLPAVDDLRLPAVVGGHLARIWNYPEFLIDVIENHDNPAESVCDREIVQIVHVADQLAEACVSMLGQSGSAEITDVLSTLTGFSSKKLLALNLALKADFHEWYDSRDRLGTMA